MENKELLFKQLVNANFGYLGSDYGFHPSGGNEYEVVYVNGSVQVVVSWDANRSYQLDIRISHTDCETSNASDPIELGELLTLTDSTRALEDTFFQASREGALAGTILRMSQLLDAHGSILLQGGVEEFRRLATQREHRRRKWRSELATNQVLAKINRAWQAKDFTNVVKLCTEIESTLPPIQKRRLAYAMSKVREEKQSP